MIQLRSTPLSWRLQELPRSGKLLHFFAVLESRWFCFHGGYKSCHILENSCIFLLYWKVVGFAVKSLKISRRFSNSSPVQNSEVTFPMSRKTRQERLFLVFSNDSENQVLSPVKIALNSPVKVFRKCEKSPGS